LGWTGEDDWEGTIPVGARPLVKDPPNGVLINANNKPVGEEYPYEIAADWPPPFRFRRITELLDGAGDLTAEKMATVQLDQHSALAELFLPFLRQLDLQDARLREIRATVAAWDGEAALDRPEPLIFTAWLLRAGPLIYGDELGELLSRYGNFQPEALERMLTEAPSWCDDVSTPATETCPQQLSRAFTGAVGDLTARLGEDWRAWQWGELHHAVMAHQPFGALPVLRWLFSIEREVGGDGSTVNVAAPRPIDAGRFDTFHMAGLRFIADLSTDRLLLVSATGQSGHPLSPYYDDLTDLWASGRYLELRVPLSQAPKRAPSP
jgi:penicillin amidase